MKKAGILLAVIAFIAMSFTTISNKEYTTNSSESKVEWKGYKTGGAHNGEINILNGMLVLENDRLVGGDFTIDMNSINVLDTDSGKLLRHLKSGDFFDVEKFPIATFKITESTIIESKTIVKGFLTIKGITEEIEFPATISKNDKDQIILESETFKVDRAKFNISYKSKTFFANLKDKFIHDEFDIKVRVVSTGNKN
jgi:polyisoprenoid-binding protein YceI